LRRLWMERSVDRFNSELVAFKSKWGVRVAGFEKYFVDTWLTANTPAEWASYARPEVIPSGTQNLEAYHNRLDTTVMPKINSKSLAIDTGIAALRKEANYQQEMAQDPQQLAERHTAANRSRRTTLRHLSAAVVADPPAAPAAPVAASNALVLADPVAPPAPAASAPLVRARIEVPSIESLDQDLDVDNGLDALVAAVDENDSVVIDRPQVEIGTRRAKKQRTQEKCMTCGSPGNKDCSNKLCVSCCGKNPLACQVQTHRKSKAEHRYVKNKESRCIRVLTSFLFLVLSSL